MFLKVTEFQNRGNTNKCALNIQNVALPKKSKDLFIDVFHIYITVLSTLTGGQLRGLVKYFIITQQMLLNLLVAW